MKDDGKEVPVIPIDSKPTILGEPSREQVMAARKLSHTITIGNRLPEEDFDIVIGNQTTCLRFARDGSVHLNGRLLGSDVEVYEGLRCFLRSFIKGSWL